jgi:hypothetical protein
MSAAAEQRFKLAATGERIDIILSNERIGKLQTSRAHAGGVS